MPALTRRFLKIFGLDAPTRIGVFGSLAEGAPATSVNPEVIQSLDAYDDGWGAAVDPLGGTPAEQDFNAIGYLTTYQIAYLLERGLAEWNSLTTYWTGSLVSDGSGNIFRSLQNTNLNHALTDGAWWTLAGGIGREPVKVIATGTSKANTFEGVVLPGATITRTLPALPTSGQLPIAITIVDSAGTASDAQKITIAPASGERFGRAEFATNDTLSINYPGGWVGLSAAPGDTAWTLQTQANTMNEITPSGGSLVPGYEDSGWITMPTVSWNGTAPTTLTTALYRWIKTGRTVELSWMVIYTNAGSGITQATWVLPGTAPAPSLAVAVNQWSYNGQGGLATAPTNSQVGSVLMDSSTGGVNTIYTIQASGAYRVSRGSITYFTDV